MLKKIAVFMTSVLVAVSLSGVPYVSGREKPAQKEEQKKAKTKKSEKAEQKKKAKKEAKKKKDKKSSVRGTIDSPPTE